MKEAQMRDGSIVTDLKTKDKYTLIDCKLGDRTCYLVNLDKRDYISASDKWLYDNREQFKLSNKPDITLNTYRACKSTIGSVVADSIKKRKRIAPYCYNNNPETKNEQMLRFMVSRTEDLVSSVDAECKRYLEDQAWSMESKTPRLIDIDIDYDISLGYICFLTFDKAVGSAIGKNYISCGE